jgi:hypothetical protein
MTQLEKVRQWVESGKQIGQTISYTIQEEPHCIIVGVQKWQGSYRMQLIEFSEQDLSYDTESIREEQLSFDSFEELEKFFSKEPAVSLTGLAPIKGRKIFNPTF